MGGEAWSYFTPFEKSVHAALEKLRDQVFESGKFCGSEMDPATPEEALANMQDQGTASILDITEVSPTPEFCAVCPLSDEDLEVYFGTTEPTREMILANRDFFEPIERGQGIYITVYKNGALMSTSSQAIPSTDGELAVSYNLPMQRTAAAVYYTGGRASRVRRLGRSAALR